MEREGGTKIYIERGTTRQREREGGRDKEIERGRNK